MAATIAVPTRKSLSSNRAKVVPLPRPTTVLNSTINTADSWEPYVVKSGLQNRVRPMFKLGACVTLRSFSKKFSTSQMARAPTPKSTPPPAAPAAPAAPAPPPAKKPPAPTKTPGQEPQKLSSTAGAEGKIIAGQSDLFYYDPYY
ncbi:acrosin-like [Trichoplusia ni]|uniref:Acrosin-like n=1 Tax=Trichoplusia ni TaxID=7111 RepID=A0A7E5WU21_TRINI|nr:acrosin-like [Trichoplusia ni]